MRLEDLPYAHLLQRHTGPLRADTRYDTVHFDDLDLTGQLGGAHFLECAFTGIRAENAKLRRAGFNDAWLHGGRLVGVDLAESEWQDTEIDSTVLAGISAHSSAIRRTVFRQCKLEAVNLRGATLRDVVFEDCLLRDVDLAEAKLTNVTFPGSTLNDVRLRGATLKSVDLRRAAGLDLPDGHQGLRGAIISTHQLLDLAPQFAQALGIVVKE
ncbi:pentapeptide repeat-containing protein [Kitasatospora griseola]|uniref:Pentapeptide repeat-containing protein n=1 Tax=Kitasatospora griseola TaxID=2064 RepID=A0A0D0PIC9_KITGR|nr:pentapeptide repeat-containing protein [Kitasatospora griseola]KIQ62194.1 pentapeptide repeat-containing protein [Kitasatospora griseola]